MAQAQSKDIERRTVRPLRLVCALLLASSLLAGCGLGSRGSSTGYQYTGSWRGSVTDDAGGSGSFMVTLSQADLALAGTWHVVMGSDPARQAGGTWAGQVFVGQEKDLLEVTLSPSLAGQCSYRMTLSRTNDSLTGEYAATSALTGCTNLTRGTLQMTKQQ